MKVDIHKMGTKADLRHRIQHRRIDNTESRTSFEKARSYVFKGFKVDGSKVGGVKGMDSQSRTPTRVSQICSKTRRGLSLVLQNAFSKKLGEYDFDMYSMFVVDFLHEFELGVWKATLVHLIRIMYAHGDSTITKFNKR
jgi:hypothetical protein